MARRLVAFLLLALLTGTLARAQQLQRLHVRSFVLTSGTSRPKIDVPFEVTLTIRVAENLNVQNVFLPTFVGPEELGDVRQQSRGPSGTVYRETLTLVTRTPGPLSIGSAYLDAIDARDGKPKRFLSNGLQLNVPGPSVNIWRAFGPSDVMLLALLGAFIAIRMYLRRRPVVPRHDQVTVPPSIAPVTAHSDPNPLQAALAELNAARDRKSVMRVRSVLWHIAGASEGQTLAFVLQQPQAVDEDLRRMLVLAERAAFVDEHRLAAAIDALLAQREGSIA